MISPDGNFFLASDPQGKVAVHAMQGTAVRPVAGINEDDDVAAWSADGRSLYVYRRGEMPFHVFRLDLSTGRKEPLNVVAPADTSGAERSHILFTPDGKGYVYEVARPLCELYLVDIWPLAPDKPGHMRPVCMSGGRKLVVHNLQGARPAFRLLSTWPRDAR
jgi:hypothetical protein